MGEPMITVAGEALIDLIVDQAGQVDPRMGGGPFNVARAVARLGQPVTFLGRLSGDRFGQLMRADLWPALEAGKLAMPIDRTFPLEKAADALAVMRANAHFGKIVLTME